MPVLATHLEQAQLLFQLHDMIFCLHSPFLSQRKRNKKAPAPCNAARRGNRVKEALRPHPGASGSHRTSAG